MTWLVPYFVFLHVLGVVFAFGPTFSYSIWGGMLKDEPQHRDFFARGRDRVSQKLTWPATLSLFVTGVLIIVAWNMVEKEEAWALIRLSSGDALGLAATFLLVVFRDLTEGILVGFLLGSVLFIQRMAHAAHVDERAPLAEGDRADEGARYEGPGAADEDILIYRIQGAFFFGAASTVGGVLERISDRPRTFIIGAGAGPSTLTASVAFARHRRAISAASARAFTSLSPRTTIRTIDANGG